MQDARLVPGASVARWDLPRLLVPLREKTVARYNLGRHNKSLHASRDCVSLKMLYQFIVAAIARPRELNRYVSSLTNRDEIATHFGNHSGRSF